MLKLNFRASFTTRLIAGCLISLFLLSIPVALTGHWVLRDNTVKRAGSNALAQTEQIALAVDRHLNAHLKGLVYTSEIERTFGVSTPEQYSKILQTMNRHMPGYLWIGLAAPDGTVLAALDDLLVGKSVAARPWFKRGLIEPAIMDVHEAALLAALLPARADEKYQFIDFTTPLKNDAGEVIGVIGIHLDWKQFISEIEQDVFNTINPASPTVILASDGSLRMGNRLELADFQDKTAWQSLQGFQRAVTGESNWSIETLSDGNDYLVAFAPNRTGASGGLGWVSATVTPLDSVASPVSLALAGAIAALLIGTATTLLLVLALGRSLSGKAKAYLELVRKDDREAVVESMQSLPTELQPISRDILDLTRGLSEKSRSLEKALQSAKESYWVVEALIVQAPVPIAMFDMDMNYVAASARWSQTFTTETGSLVGKNHYAVVPNQNESWRNAHQAGLNGKGSFATAEEWVNALGDTLWLDWALEPWTKPDGKQGGIILMCKDVTQEKQIRNELAESEERFKLAMEGSHDGLWDWDVVNGKVYLSPSWKRMLGYEDSELPNEFATWERLTAPADAQATIAKLQAALDNPDQKSYESEFCMAHKNGHWVHVLARGFIVRNDRGEAIRVVGTHLDRTVQLELEGQLRKAAIAAQAEKDSNAEKSRFLATMSHEIRTPLNSILGFARLLEMDLPNGELREQAGHLVQSSETLSLILNDILDFSKFESGILQLIDAPFLLEELIKGSSELPRLNCESKGVHFELRNHVQSGQLYSGDLLRLRQILQNLLSNAIKFTAAGKVSLSVSASPAQEGHDKLTFEVRDTGLGIPKDKQGELFKPFSQVHRDNENRFGGTGLGLSIVKSLVQAMGGDIQLESAPGVGTCVKFSVTLKCVHQHNKTTQSERIVPIRPLKVLVADDTPVNVKLIQTFLKKDGHVIEVAKDGTEALDKGLAGHFDFILLDIDMPGMSGYEVAQALRQSDGPNRHTELAALTGYAFASDIEKAKNAGFDYHFAKPVQFDLLLNRLALSSQNTKS